MIIAAEVYINSSTEQSEVVIYTSLDQIYSEPVLEKFEEEMGIKVKAESEAYDLTESGLFCAKTLMNVHNKVNIMSVGFNESRSPARKGVAFIRSDPVLWTIVVESGSAVFSSMDLDTAAEIVYELMTPAMPEEKALTEEAAVQVPMCPKYGKPVTWVEQYKRWYCYSCQEYLEA